MGTIVEIPGGEAVLKDDAELTNKEVKNLRRAARMAAAVATHLQELGFKDTDPESWSVIGELTDTEDDTIDLFQRTCVVTRLESWTIDRVMPKTVEDVDDLPRPIYVPLTIAASKVSLSDDFGMDGAADPKADTESSDS